MTLTRRTFGLSCRVQKLCNWLTIYFWNCLLKNEKVVYLTEI